MSDNSPRVKKFITLFQDLLPSKEVDHRALLWYIKKFQVHDHRR